ncbi:MAG: RagB/SusD family nutrient uptake outer membrane protein [Bacteroidota bacterium]
MQFMTNYFRKARRLAFVAMLAPALLLGGCTDLGEEVFSGVEPENFFQTEAEVTAALVPVYAQLRAMLWAYHNLSQVSSDETIVPTRGEDWADGGRWLNMHRHNWDANLPDLNDAWVAAYTGVARANALLLNLEQIEIANKADIVAEVETLRAFYYYQLLDLFGGVPIVGDEEGEFLVDPDNPPAPNTRAEVYDFIVAELEAARQVLPDEAAVYGRMTKAAADAMLANLYLNAAVFQNSSDGINTSGYNSCMSTNTCDDAIAAADRVINSGIYELVSDWQSNFTPDNVAVPEHLFVVQHSNAEDGLGMNFPMRYLHYNQYSPSPWNGFSTIAETYNSFADNDSRKGIFLVGQQTNFDTGANVDDRNGNPLIYTPDCTPGDAQITNTTEGACVRVAKFPPDLSAPGGNGHSNDYAFFRLAEMYLIRAEAKNEMGMTGEAIADINVLRERVFNADADGAGTLDQFLLNAGDFDQASLRDRLLNERLYELMYEAKRRQDLIRYGLYEDAWEFKEASSAIRVLFPIPQQQLNANPNLVQNSGY